MKKTKTNVPSV